MYLSFSKIRVKELTQLPASTCKPCARATTFASAPGPSYTSQLLTTVAPNTNRRLVVYDLSLVGIGAQRRVVQVQALEVKLVVLSERGGISDLELGHGSANVVLCCTQEDLG